MKRGSPSLKPPLIVKPLIFQLATLLIACTFFMALALRMESGGLYTDEAITPDDRARSSVIRTGISPFARRRNWPSFARNLPIRNPGGIQAHYLFATGTFRSDTPSVSILLRRELHHD
ncbi:hypothetical protein ACVITL_005825 [Rhizobium pisi]